MKFMKAGNQQGFSLVELMVVVAIIGILTAVAVPKFQGFRAKAVRAEAQSTLANISTLQELYYTDADSYGTFAQIGYSTPASTKYAYALTANSATDFTVTATSNSKLCSAATNANDVLTATKAGITTTTDGLAGCL